MIIRNMLLKDLLLNIFFKIRYSFYLNFYSKKLKNKSELNKNRELIFEDDFNEISWNKNTRNIEKWSVGPAWGHYHPNPSFANSYFDEPKGIIDSCVVLDCIYQPKTFNINKDNEITIPYKHSYLEINDKYRKQYGRFECRCKMPMHQASWPAFWLAGISWPPEIDIFETYGKKTGKNINTQEINLHYGITENNTKKQLRAWSVKYSKKNKTNFNEFALEWNKNKIEIFVNGIKVFIYRRKDILDKWFNIENANMLTIINNNICDDHDDYKRNNISYNSIFLVDYVRIYK